MVVSKNPNEDKIRELCGKSEHNAAKWIKDTETGDFYYWPASDLQHVQMAKQLHIETFEKGIATP